MFEFFFGKQKTQAELYKEVVHNLHKESRRAQLEEDRARDDATELFTQAKNAARVGDTHAARLSLEERRDKLGAADQYRKIRWDLEEQARQGTIQSMQTSLQRAQMRQTELGKMGINRATHEQVQQRATNYFKMAENLNAKYETVVDTGLKAVKDSNAETLALDTDETDTGIETILEQFHEEFQLDLPRAPTRLPVKQKRPVKQGTQ